jgi:hypothetical protein
MRRDIVEEIVARRARNPASSRIGSYSARHKSIASAFETLLQSADPSATSVDAELSRHFPVALVAAIEAYFRQCVADLVNAGSPFLDRAIKLRDVSLSLPAAASLLQKRITLGDYVAHFVSISSLDDINRVLSTLLELDFLETLLTSEFHVFDPDDPLVLRDARKEIISAARDLFQQRHILCHEFGEDVRPNISELLRMLTVADVLVGLAEVVVWAEESRHGG